MNIIIDMSGMTKASLLVTEHNSMESKAMNVAMLNKNPSVYKDCVAMKKSISFINYDWIN